MLAALADPRYAKNVPVMAGTTRDEVTLWLGLSRYFVDVSYPFTKVLPAKLRIKDPALYAFWVDMRSRGWKLARWTSPYRACVRQATPIYMPIDMTGTSSPTITSCRFPRSSVRHASEIAFIMGAPMYGASAITCIQTPTRRQR